MRDRLNQARETRERKRQQARRFVIVLLAILLLSAIFLAWSTWHQSRRRLAVGELEAAGWVFGYGTSCPEWFFDLFGEKAAEAFFPKRVRAIRVEAIVDWEQQAASEVTDEMLGRLKWFPRVESLYLQGSRVTDEGLAHLTGLNRLKHLDLRGTGVTDQGVEKLRQELPDVQIQREPTTEQ